MRRGPDRIHAKTRYGFAPETPQFTPDQHRWFHLQQATRALDEALAHLHPLIKYARQKDLNRLRRAQRHVHAAAAPLAALLEEEAR